jgi:hypothetical protein
MTQEVNKTIYKKEIIEFQPLYADGSCIKHFSLYITFYMQQSHGGQV